MDSRIVRSKFRSWYRFASTIRRSVISCDTPMKPTGFPLSLLMIAVFNDTGNSVPSFLQLRISPFHPPAIVAGNISLVNAGGLFGDRIISIDFPINSSLEAKP